MIYILNTLLLQNDAKMVSAVESSKPSKEIKMSTRYGADTLEWLKARGWKEVPLAPGVMGDPHVTDPVTGATLDVYSAAKLQRQRTGEYPKFLKAD